MQQSFEDFRPKIAKIFWNLTIKSGKNIMYTFAIWTIIVNVYIIFLPDFILIKLSEKSDIMYYSSLWTTVGRVCTNMSKRQFYCQKIPFCFENSYLKRYSKNMQFSENLNICCKPARHYVAK